MARKRRNAAEVIQATIARLDSEIQEKENILEQLREQKANAENQLDDLQIRELRLLMQEYGINIHTMREILEQHCIKTQDSGSDMKQQDAVDIISIAI